MYRETALRAAPRDDVELQIHVHHKTNTSYDGRADGINDLLTVDSVWCKSVEFKAGQAFVERTTADRLRFIDFIRDPRQNQYIYRPIPAAEDTQSWTKDIMLRRLLDKTVEGWRTMAGVRLCARPTWRSQFQSGENGGLTMRWIYLAV